MDNFLDKEYHPVIEDFITDYVDDEMGSVERATFEEVLVHDDDLRELAFSAKEGKKLLSQFREVKAGEDFMEKLMKKIS
ncbi:MULTISPECIES: hypothetical protein [Gracilimonas]|uniref:Uncharacterized protein n=1 Tax=Gracilimonas sediminicola TaxID=2952158 RepID=A0A9X2RFH0_9BACT|nr:hypothetical protein [Gracilimonas sediminicola]MCP9292630.1 hypothetical protein [Gracilimonas sediminicola]